MALTITRKLTRSTYSKSPLDVEAELITAFSVLTPSEKSRLRYHLRRGTPLLFGANARAFRRRGRG